MGPALQAQDTVSNPEARVEQLLSEAGLFFQKETNDGNVQYRIKIDAGDTQSVITLRIHTWKWTMSDGSPLYSLYCYVPVQSTDAQHPFSLVVSQKVSEYNDSLLTGNCSLTATGIYANSGFYLHGLTADMFANYLYALHFNGVGLQEALAPVFAAEGAEN
jgi:hypothetical protein